MTRRLFASLPAVIGDSTTAPSVTVELSVSGENEVDAEYLIARIARAMVDFAPHVFVRSIDATHRVTYPESAPGQRSHTYRYSFTGDFRK